MLGACWGIQTLALPFIQSQLDEYQLQRMDWLSMP